MSSVDERIAACGTDKPEAKALQVQVQVRDGIRMDRGLSGALRKIGMPNATAALNASPQQAEQAVRN